MLFVLLASAPVVAKDLDMVEAWMVKSTYGQSSHHMSDASFSTPRKHHLRPKTSRWMRLHGETHSLLSDETSFPSLSQMDIVKESYCNWKKPAWHCRTKKPVDRRWQTPPSSERKRWKRPNMALNAWPIVVYIKLFGRILLGSIPQLRGKYPAISSAASSKASQSQRSAALSL